MTTTQALQSSISTLPAPTRELVSSGEKDGFLYYNGLLVTADGDSRYEVYKVDGKYYLVNGSGKVQTNEKAYKSDGDYVYLVEDREVYYTDDSGRKTKKADSGASALDFTCDRGI
ncbi:MAG: hypothetical protein ACLR0U_10125 [Enterocloster clostridioformis]